MGRYGNLSVIIPTLNEGELIGKLVSELLKSYPGICVIVCDDGSSDNTEMAVKSTQSRNVKFIDRTNAKTHGLAASVIDGILKCRTEFFVLMDGDLQHPPEKIGQIYSKLSEGFDIVIASRKKVIGNWPPHRRLESMGANLLGHLKLIGKGYLGLDIRSGFFGMRTKLAVECYGMNRKRFVLEGYQVLFEYLKAIRRVKIASIPYTFGERHVGKSKLGPKHMFFFIRSLLS